MLPIGQRVAFAVFAVVTIALAARGFYRMYLRVRRGRADADSRTGKPLWRAWYALKTTLLQQRVFRARPVLSVFHSFIFYAFVLYGLVNLLDAADGYVALPRVVSRQWLAAYGFLTDAFSVLAIVGVLAFVLRRFLMPSRRDFRFPEKTLLQQKIRDGAMQRDSLIVAAFIVFHVGCRVAGHATEVAMEGPQRAQPFSNWLAQYFGGAHAMAWREFGYWGALGSVLLFLMYFPYSKHVHLLMAPLKYFFHRDKSSGVLPALRIDLEDAEMKLGAETLADLAWPRLLDAYACIQCNRCQDVCPASRTGKALSPAALEINKRMVLNGIAEERGFASMSGLAAFESGTSNGPALLQAVISPESVWACTTCGACMEVCPTQNEPMLDIIDIRRQQVMLAGEFPAPLQAAFRGMERNSNPWGLAREKRMEWATGLRIPTMEDVPDPDVLYWVGCAASYDTGAQKTARAVVQLLVEAEVSFVVLGNKESCTGDSARRAGNEMLFQEMAKTAIATLREAQPKLVLASCPHCVNTIAREYPQLGGNFKVMHHTEYLQMLLDEGRLKPESSKTAVTFHDPCYLGRHAGMYDAPRIVLEQTTSGYVEMERTRSNSFCCGAGGAQFWKEEEPGAERVSENRFQEALRVLSNAKGEEDQDKVLAVGCPFCKSMLQSAPSAGQAHGVVVKDVAEILLERMTVKKSLVVPDVRAASPAVIDSVNRSVAPVAVRNPEVANGPVAAQDRPAAAPEQSVAEGAATPRKKWQPKKSS